MGRVEFEKNGEGFADLRYSDQVRALLEAVGSVVLDAANDSLKLNGPDDPSPGYVMYSQPGEHKGTLGRWRVSVTAVTPHAVHHEGVHNTLLRALGGAQVAGDGKQ